MTLAGERGSLTDRLLLAGRVFRLLSRLQNLDQFPQFTQEKTHLLAIGRCLLGLFLFTARIAFRPLGDWPNWRDADRRTADMQFDSPAFDERQRRR